MSTDAVKKFLELAQANSELNDQMKTVVAERGEESSFELVELAAQKPAKKTARKARTKNVLPPEEEAEVKDRLRRLGYLV